MLQIMKLGERGKFNPLSSHVGKWVEQLVGPSYHRFRAGEIWTPSVNVYEDQAGYHIVADLAGMKADEIELRVEKGVLVISGQRQPPGAECGGGSQRVHLMEIDYGRFSRRVELPSDVDVSAIEANYKGGYLCVRLPKRS